MLYQEVLDELILYCLLKNQRTVYRVRKYLLLIFGYNLSFGTLFPHVDKLIEKGYIWKSAESKHENLTFTPAGRNKYNSLLDEMFRVQQILAPEIATLDLKKLAERVGVLESQLEAGAKERKKLVRVKVVEKTRSRRRMIARVTT